MTRTPHPIDQHVGARLRLCRVENDLTQTQLGEKLDLSFQQIQKCEKGANRISASVLFRMTGIFDVSVLHFFDGLTPDSDSEVKKKHNIEFTNLQSAREDLRILKAYSNITDKNIRRTILHLVEEISDNDSH
ncbi:MAG: helix-turn-helix transcriptional regulator [Hyphomicrobiales bacterium]|nr:helix-turn-helix transcriptional regulator [Hyphomicrobiales bacterium]